MPCADPPPARAPWRDWLIRPGGGERLRLGLRNLYIVPTGFGAQWLAAALLLVLVGLQLERNGPLLLGFLMLALLLLALHLTHLNLQGLELACIEAKPAFAPAASYPLELRSRRRREALQLGFAAGGLLPARDLEAGRVRLAVPWRAGQRGLHPPGRLRLQSTAPLGLFLCWSVWEPSQPQLIYPARRPGPTRLITPPGPGQPPTDRGGGRQGSEEWHDLAPHRPEEGSTRLAWKQLARGQGRHSKRFRDPALAALLLGPAAHLPLDLALEHLSARLWQLARQGRSFGLVLPDRQVPVATGMAQLRRCLEALALCQAGS